MAQEVGSIITGKVTGITKFGAFIDLGGGDTGLVHISEVAHSYVSDITEHLAVGQEVSVRVMSVGQEGRISLSVKKAQKPPKRENRTERRAAPPRQPVEPETFEDRLSKFMQDSKNNLSSSKLYTEKRSKRR